MRLCILISAVSVLTAFGSVGPSGPCRTVQLKPGLDPKDVVRQIHARGDMTVANLDATPAASQPGDWHRVPASLRGRCPALSGRSSEETIRAQAAPTPAISVLEHLSQAERKNSRISVEFESFDSAAVLLGREVERLWNGGQYDEALAQLGNLEARVGHVAIGNSWRKPVPTRETNLWGTDVRIGNRDSLLGVTFDADYVTRTGNFFVALRHSNGPAYYSVCMSINGGASWAETFTWVGSPTTSLDAGILYQHFYVAYYSPGENPQQVRLRRFLCSDGSAHEFSNGSMWVAACTLDVGDTAREVSLLSTKITCLYVATLVSDGSVLLRGSDEASWWKWSTGIDSGASRGLDATNNFGGSGSTGFLLSYLDATDTLRIYGNRLGGFTQRLALSCGTGKLTSISAYSDSVICAYEDGTSSPRRVGYAVSYDGGDTWTTGTLSDTGIAAEAPAVLAPYYARHFAAVYRHESLTPELHFCWRAASGPWSDPVSIADNEPCRSRPGIGWLGGDPDSAIFGVVYLSDTSPVVRGAYFDRGMGPYGVTEQQRPEASSRAPLATVVRRVLSLPGRTSSSPSSLLDIGGRKVLDLRPGVNDVRALAPGVYFVREAQAQTQAQAVRKIVIAR